MDLLGIATDPFTGWVAARMWEQQFSCEREIIGAMMAAPGRGVVDGARAGCRAVHFHDTAYSTVWLAAVASWYCDHLTGNAGIDRERVLLLARDNLRAAGEWHDRLPLELADASTNRPGYFAGDVARCARRLVASANRIAELNRLYKRALAIVAEGANE